MDGDPGPVEVFHGSTRHGEPPWNPERSGRSGPWIPPTRPARSRSYPDLEIRPGDVIYTPDGEEHWHGATPGHFMAHLSISEGAPYWGDHVTDAEYRQSQ